MDRVCLHAPSTSGGHALYVQELMSALARHPRGGDRFELVTGEDLQPQFRSDLYAVHAVLPRLPHKREFRTRLAWAANRALHYPRCDRTFRRWLTSRPDIKGVHFQEFSRSLPPLIRWVRASGRKAYYTVHNIRPHSYPPLVPRRLWDHRNRQACRQFDRLFVHTDRLREDLAQFLGGQHPPIDVVPHGVWTISNPSAIPPLRERLEWRRLLFFGTIRRNKGLDLLFRAVAALPGFSLTIAGEPRELDYFRAEVLPQVARLRDAGVAVELIDRFVPESEVGPLFARHSAVVLPYTQEFTAQSGVVFLALAHGIPVVASEAGGLRDLFGEFTIGSSFRDPTPEAFVAAVRSLFAAGARREDLAGQIRAARERFSWSAAAGATLSAYASGAGPGAGGGRAAATRSDVLASSRGPAVGDLYGSR